MSETTLTVKDFNIDDRPQEKAIQYGVGALSVSELWAVVLRSGQPGFPVTRLAAEMMGANSNKLHELAGRSREELMEIRGIGLVKAVQIQCVLELINRYNREMPGERFKVCSSADIFRYMQPRVGMLPHEEVWVMFLNNNLQVTGDKGFTKGSATASIFDVKAIVREALLRGAAAIVLVHNHPSGVLRPSPQDDNITAVMKRAADALTIRMVDHVIVSQTGFYSYSDEGRL